MVCYNGVSMMPLVNWSAPDAVLSCDGCFEGCGGWFDGKFFHASFPPEVRDLELHVNALELLTLMVSLKLWGHLLRGLRVKLFCDNEASVIVLNSGKSRDQFMQACLREICFLAASFEFEFRCVHLPGVDNRLPDHLSRWSSAEHRRRFCELTNHITVVEYPVHDALFSFDHKW